MRRRGRALAHLAAALVLAVLAPACRTIGAGSGDPIRIRVPMIRQGTGYTCGVTVLQSILFHWGEEWREDNLARELGATPEQGTNYRQIARLAEARGFRVEVVTPMTLDQLTSAVNEGWPVVVALQAWGDHPEAYAGDWEDGHYVVVVGHDRHSLYFMDPSTIGHYTFIPIAEFLTRWHDVFVDTDGQEVRLLQLGMIFRRAERPTYDPKEITRLE